MATPNSQLGGKHAENILKRLGEDNMPISFTHKCSHKWIANAMI